MVQYKETYRDAIFIIIKEESCPFYSVGEEMKVISYGLSMSAYKPGCLFLARKIAAIVTAKESFGAFAKLSAQKARYDCGGCQGKIHFEFKRDKDFSTLQMKLLQEAEEKRRKKHLEKYYGVMRALKLFKPLEDDPLKELITLLEFKTIPLGKIVVKKGTPGTNFFIILHGHVERKADDGSKLADIKAGEMFGEMSLLSTEPFTHSIYSVKTTHMAILSIKNFKEILSKFPVLQMFLFKLLVDQAQAVALKAGNISSGMTGELSEVGVLDLLQLINSSRKTGTLDLALDKGRGMIFFREGEIVYARYLKFRGKQVIHLLLGIKDGRFSYTNGIPEVLDKTPPIGGFMNTVMEGLQKVDDVIAT
jgi:CRP-like cAMP-binding protein